MKSLRFDFGTDLEGKADGKGIDWLLDVFLEKKITGQAGFDYEIVQTPPNIIAELLNDKYQYENVGRILQLYTFYSLFLNMNVKMNEPDKWILNWARFEFEMNGTNLSILSYAPDVEGIKTEIEKNGSREFNLSFSGELKPAVDPVDAKMSSEAKYDRKNAWTKKYENMIKEVKGYKTRTIDGKVNLQWDIYNNKAIEVPESNIGVTTGVYATALVSIPKRSQAFADVKISGDTVHRGTSLRSHGIIELASRGRFSIEPTV